MVIVVAPGFDGCRKWFWGPRLMVLWWLWMALPRMVMVAMVVGLFGLKVMVTGGDG